MRLKKKKLIPIPKLKKQVQQLFNKFIRERDCKDDKFICISCGRELPKEKCQAGHLFGTKKYNWLRFDEHNVNGQCQYCNGFNHEALIGYTLNLPYKIGQENFNKLIEKSKIKKEEFTRETLNKLKEKYARNVKINQLK